MNANLEAQINFAHPLLEEASSRRDIAEAKMALGLIAGALIAASPEDDHYLIRRIVMDAVEDRNLDTVLDMAAWLIRRSHDLI